MLPAFAPNAIQKALLHQNENRDQSDPVPENGNGFTTPSSQPDYRANMQKLALTLFGLALALPVHADFKGKVVAVTDGDTIIVLHEGFPERIRLVEIDAPEKRQPFGRRSTETLSELCLHKMATLIEKGRDRYGRTLARVTCDGQDANAEQVRKGMAWAYTKYLTDPTIKALEAQAMAAKAGLWVDPSPIPPWDWRKTRSGSTLPFDRKAHLLSQKLHSLLQEKCIGVKHTNLRSLDQIGRANGSAAAG